MGEIQSATGGKKNFKTGLAPPSHEVLDGNRRDVTVSGGLMPRPHGHLEQAGAGPVVKLGVENRAHPSLKLPSDQMGSPRPLTLL